MSGAHTDLDGKLPIVLGTIPLATSQAPNTAPYTDTVPQQPQAPILDPSLAPTQPVSPASPPGAANGGGWNLYPSIRKSKSPFHSFYLLICLFSSIPAAPTYDESAYRANIVDKNESQHMRTAGGQADFAPRYPVFSAHALPPLPNTQ